MCAHGRRAKNSIGCGKQLNKKEQFCFKSTDVALQAGGCADLKLNPHTFISSTLVHKVNLRLGIEKIMI